MQADSPTRINRGIEENTLAILDSSGVGNSRDIHDDRLAFLEAVRFVSLASKRSTAPTWKMYDAVFHIFRDGSSLEEIMASYQLLVELEKHYPRLSLVDKSKSESTFGKTHELAVAKEAWLPFVGSGLSMHDDRVNTSTSSNSPLDAHGFSTLTHEISLAACAFDSEVTLQLVKNILLFQYLVHVLVGDFLSRERIFKATMNWVFLRESLLSLILGSRKINVRNFVQDCIAIISGGLFNHKNGCHHDLTLHYATLEMGKKTVVAVEKLLSMVAHYDIHRKVADAQGHTSRADAVRVPLIEMIVDQLSYNKEAISPFLQSFSEPEWKLEIIVQYFWKYCSRTSIHTRRSNSSSEDATFEAILNCFSNISSTKSLVRKMSSEVAQLLLAHGFQAYVSLRCNMKLPAIMKGVGKDDPLLHVSENLICAFENIKKNNEEIHLSAFEKEALFTAATIQSIYNTSWNTRSSFFNGK